MAARGGGKISKFEDVRGRARADTNSSALSNSIVDREKHFFLVAIDDGSCFFFRCIYFRKKSKINSNSGSAVRRNDECF